MDIYLRSLRYMNTWACSLNNQLTVTVPAVVPTANKFPSLLNSQHIRSSDPSLQVGDTGTSTRTMLCMVYLSLLYVL